MGRKRKPMPGLYLRKGTWHIDKVFRGQRICESCETSDLDEAERYLIHKLEQIRLAKVYGVRPQRTFREAVIKYLKESQHKRSLAEDAWAIKTVDPYIGKLSLEAVHMGSLQPYIEARRKAGVKSRTINYGLQVVRQILNLAAGAWLDEHGLTWLASAPKITLLDEKKDKRSAYPLSWEEQDRLFNQLPLHLRRMALFAVNTGCRNREVCRLKWEWEIPIPELNTSVFIIPGELVKNEDDRLVILNEEARRIVDDVRGIDPAYVFTYRGKPIQHMLRTAWKKARKRACLDHVRVHDLKHTFGRRLRALGVSFEDRQDLLGHKSARITTHYSAAEIHKLLEAANKVCQRAESSPVLTILKRPNANAVVPFRKKNVTAKNLGLNALNKDEIDESRKSPARAF